MMALLSNQIQNLTTFYYLCCYYSGLHHCHLLLRLTSWIVCLWHLPLPSFPQPPNLFSSQQLEGLWGILYFPKIEIIIPPIPHTLLQCELCHSPTRIGVYNTSYESGLTSKTCLNNGRSNILGFPQLVHKNPCCFGLLEVLPLGCFP